MQVEGIQTSDQQSVKYLISIYTTSAEMDGESLLGATMVVYGGGGSAATLTEGIILNGVIFTAMALLGVVLLWDDWRNEQHWLRSFLKLLRRRPPDT